MFFWERLHWFLDKSKITCGGEIYRGGGDWKHDGGQYTVRQIGDLELTD